MRSRFLFVLLYAFCLPSVGAQDSPTPDARPQPTRAVRLSGGLNAYAGFYQASGIAARNQPAPLGLSGAVTLQLPGGISLPFSVVVGNQGTSFRQPFNQVGISPTYKWITVHAGYRNITFSPFTLAGHTFLGGGVELNPGKFRLGAVYGRFNKAISSTLTEPDIIPAYQRTGYSVKLGYGRPNNYVDLVMLKAQDDVNSIAPVAQTAAQTVKPAENLVLGTTARLLILKRITVEADVAVSAYNRDAQAAETDVGTDPLVRWALQLFKPRLSTQITQATQAAVGYRFKAGSVRLQYKRIDPNFQTMGAYYFQSDIESYAIAPALTLAGGKLRLAASYGVQYDNLAGNRAARTGRQIGSLTASYNPGTKLGFDLQLTNYGLSQQAGFRPLIDTIRLAQNNFSVTGNVRYTLQGESAFHVLNVTTTYQQLSDLNQRTAAFTENQNLNVTGGYTYQPSAGGLGGNLLLTYTETGLPGFSEVPGGAPGTQTVRFYGPTLGLNYVTLKQKLNNALSASYLINQQAGVTGQVLNANATSTYQIGGRQNVSLQLAYLNSNTGIAAQRFNELRGSLGYGISF